MKTSTTALAGTVDQDQHLILLALLWLSHQSELGSWASGNVSGLF